MKKNVILLSIDTLRPDRLSCNGYEKIRTPHIDELAHSGVTYNNCISASCLTPVSMASVMTAKYPSKQGLRDPFGKIDATTVTELFKNKGYATAGFTGINFLSERCNFHKAFDVWSEPTAETGWFQKEYKAENGEQDMTTQWGNWWPPQMMDFIQGNKDKPFFTWGHYFEVHFHAEKWMLKEGMLEQGVNSENAYYDAKIKYLDEHVVGPINTYLKSAGLWEKTMVVLMSDHGETMMRKPGRPLDDMAEDYPKHRTMSQDDLKSTLIMTGGVRTPGTKENKLVRTIDVVPTILDVCFGEKMWDADGQSLYRNFEELPAYSEEMFEKRGAGALQAVQDSRFKFMRNNTTGSEQFINLQSGKDVIDDTKYSINVDVAKEILDSHLTPTSKTTVSPEDEAVVLAKLKELGYV